MTRIPRLVRFTFDASPSRLRNAVCGCRQFSAGLAVRRPNVVAALEERGLLQSATSADLKAQAAARTFTVYAGFDPTARSLHVGNLLTIVGLLHFHLAGHNVIALLGGATATIGDPTGRTTERPVLTPSELALNTASIDWQLQSVFQTAWNRIREVVPEDAIGNRTNENGDEGSNSSSITVVNNLDWFGGMSLLAFLKDVGRHARVPQMLGRDSVKSRLAPSADGGDGNAAPYEGISYTEFTYQLLQAYDFAYLHQSFGCNIQIGGSDQWGNITAGTDLIRRKSGRDNDAFGITLPLVVNDKGEKFGKSAGNAIWLDDSMCSVFDFYQFFRRQPDSMCPVYLRYFTFLPVARIDEIIERHQADPSTHLMQRTLAGEVTRMVHGPEKALRAETQSSVLYDEDVTAVPLNRILAAFEGDQRLASIDRGQALGSDVWKVALAVGLVPSKSQAIKLLKAGGMYLNKAPVTEGHTLRESDLIHGSLFTLRVGKANYKVVKLLS